MAILQEAYVHGKHTTCHIRFGSGSYHQLARDRGLQRCLAGQRRRRFNVGGRNYLFPDSVPYDVSKDGAFIYTLKYWYIRRMH